MMQTFMRIYGDYRYFMRPGGRGLFNVDMWLQRPEHLVPALRHFQPKWLDW